MDANGLKYWSLVDEGDWGFDLDAPVFYDPGSNTLKLDSFHSVDFNEPPVDPDGLLNVVPSTVDAYDTYAFYHFTQRRVYGTGAAPGIVLLASGGISQGRDMAMGYDGILYISFNGVLNLVDPRGRWPVSKILKPEPSVFRLAALPQGGVLALDRTAKKLWISKGQPFPANGFRNFDGDVFRPDQENPDPPRMEPLLYVPMEEDPIAVVTNSLGDALVMCWLSDRKACVRRINLEGQLGPQMLLGGLERPFSVGWLDAKSIAVLVQTTTDIQVVSYDFPVSDKEFEAPPLGGAFPLPNYVPGPFARSLNEPVRFPVLRPGSSIPDLPQRLVQVSAPELQRAGEAINAKPLDSQQPNTVWHRLYLEAVLPKECGARIWLAATDTPPRPNESEFFEHVFGDVSAEAGVPRGVWSSLASELPFHSGLIPCPREPYRAGLFGALIQRARRRVSSLVGRYLHVRIELVGNGRATPEISAIRAYGSRFSYVDRYLPRIYRETVFSPDADEVLGPTEATTPADFLERFLGNFEGILTPLEDRVANAHLLTDPVSTPNEALPWLSEWVGLVFDPAYPPDKRRRALSHATELHRWHGTLRGLTLALNILTDDAVERGEIVVVEDYRLRRTFATILGADLADEHDPLTAGIVESGNSIVGDTLILGEENHREFLAVYRELLPVPSTGTTIDQTVTSVFQSGDSATVDDFFDRFANRLTIFVQKETTEDRVRLINRILEFEAPAHLATQVVFAQHPFIVGLASLVGVDTFVREPDDALSRTLLEESRVGTSFLLRPAALDPRLEVNS